MGIRDWLRKTLGRRPPVEMVPFFNVEGGRVVRIPASELRAGAVQVRLAETGEIVWALPDDLQAGEVRHPEFDEGVRDYIRRIHSTFAEHRPISFEEWEHGFRCDMNPGREIALWLHAADVYTAFTADEPDAHRRCDVYRCIVACLTTGPDAVWNVYRPETLSRAEAEQVVDGFFGKAE